MCRLFNCRCALSWRLSAMLCLHALYLLVSREVCCTSLSPSPTILLSPPLNMSHTRPTSTSYNFQLILDDALKAQVPDDRGVHRPKDTTSARKVTSYPEGERTTRVILYLIIIIIAYSYLLWMRGSRLDNPAARIVQNSFGASLRIFL